MAFINVDFALNQPQACHDHSQTYLLLILIHTNFRNYDRREVSRETWAASGTFDDSIVVLYFLNKGVDNSDFSAYNSTLYRESDIHHDVILPNFSHSDHFTNMLVPSIMWINKFCPRVSYVLNVVDNSVVDLYKLTLFLKSTENKLSGPQLLCDYVMPNESTVFNGLGKTSKGFCSSSAYLATPSTMEVLSSTLQNYQDNLHGAWLSDICRLASIPIARTRKIFTGSRKKPSMLKDLMSSNYLNTDIMVAVIRSVIPGRETAIMRQVWQMIQNHRKDEDDKEKVSVDSSDSGSIFMFAAILMLIDFFVIFLIFSLLFCKRRLKFNV